YIPTTPTHRVYPLSLHDALPICEIAKLSPDTIKGYQALSAAGQKTNLLGPKTRELISLAVAVTVRCDGCITVHAEAAARHGASRDRKSTRLNSSHQIISYAVFCL